MKILKWAGTISLLVLSAGAANAASVTPDIIFGSGNANGSFTVTNTLLSFPSNPIGGNLELGLRAKLRYDATSGCPGGVGCPQNQFNWDGVDTYSFDLSNGNPPPNRAMWTGRAHIFDVEVQERGEDTVISIFVRSDPDAEIAVDEKIESHDVIETARQALERLDVDGLGAEGEGE